MGLSGYGLFPKFLSQQKQFTDANRQCRRRKMKVPSAGVSFLFLSSPFLPFPFFSFPLFSSLCSFFLSADPETYSRTNGPLFFHPCYPVTSILVFFLLIVNFTIHMLINAVVVISMPIHSIIYKSVDVSRDLCVCPLTFLPLICASTVYSKAGDPIIHAQKNLELDTIFK